MPVAEILVLSFPKDQVTSKAVTIPSLPCSSLCRNPAVKLPRRPSWEETLYQPQSSRSGHFPPATWNSKGCLACLVHFLNCWHKKQPGEDTGFFWVFYKKERNSIFLNTKITFPVLVRWEIASPRCAGDLPGNKMLSAPHRDCRKSVTPSQRNGLGSKLGWHQILPERFQWQWKVLSELMSTQKLSCCKLGVVSPEEVLWRWAEQNVP